MSQYLLVNTDSSQRPQTFIQSRVMTGLSPPNKERMGFSSSQPQEGIIGRCMVSRTAALRHIIVSCAFRAEKHQITPSQETHRQCILIPISTVKSRVHGPP